MAKILVDTMIAVVLFGSLYAGYRRGLVRALLGLAGFATVLLLCLTFGETLAKPLKPYVPLPVTYATLVAYIVICFVIALLAYFLHRVFDKLLAKRVPPTLDAIGGMFVGALRGAVFTALALLILVLIANPTIHENVTHKSWIGGAFFEKVSKVSPTLNEIYISPPSLLRERDVRKRKSDYEEAWDSFQPDEEEEKEK